MSDNFSALKNKLISLEQRMRENVERDNPEFIIHENTYDDFWGWHTHYRINVVSPNIYVERNAGDNPGHPRFFGLFNDLNQDSSTARITLFGKSLLIFSIGDIVSFKLNANGENTVRVPSRKEPYLDNNLDIEQVLKSEIERPDIDEAQKNLLQQGLAFWQSVERYATRGDIVKGTQGSKETQGNIGQGTQGSKETQGNIGQGER